MAQGPGAAAPQPKSAASAPPAGAGNQAGAGVAVVTTPDGSRCLLLPTAAFPHVTWTIATLADPWLEPAGLEGLTAAVVEASLGGTWRTGTADAARERLAFQEHEDTLRALLAAPTDAAARQRLLAADSALRELGQPQAFRALLADLPAHGVDVVWREGLVAIQFTTLPDSIERAAACWVEWREEQALRRLPATWPATVVRLTTNLDLDPAIKVRAELLSLALPGHPLARQLDRPSQASPTRAQALQCWQSRMHPANALHVLVGDFDAAAAREALLRTFRSTSLPPPAPANLPPVRAIASTRRAAVRGTSQPITACAWLLTEPTDPAVLDTAVRWFAGGAGSVLGRAVAARCKGATVRAVAPWPPAPGGRGLFVVEVLGGEPHTDLAALVLETATAAVGRAPTENDLWPAVNSRQRSAAAIHNDPRWLGIDLARSALRAPDLPTGPRQPTMVPPANLQRLLATLFAGQPVVVEGRP